MDGLGSLASGVSFVAGTVSPQKIIRKGTTTVTSSMLRSLNKLKRRFEDQLEPLDFYQNVVEPLRYLHENAADYVDEDMINQALLGVGKRVSELRDGNLSQTSEDADGWIIVTGGAIETDPDTNSDSTEVKQAEDKHLSSKCKKIKESV